MQMQWKIQVLNKGVHDSNGMHMVFVVSFKSLLTSQALCHLYWLMVRLHSDSVFAWCSSVGLPNQTIQVSHQ